MNRKEPALGIRTSKRLEPLPDSLGGSTKNREQFKGSWNPIGLSLSQYRNSQIKLEFCRPKRIVRISGWNIQLISRAEK
jgi:hypothetical protein